MTATLITIRMCPSPCLDINSIGVNDFLTDALAYGIWQTAYSCFGFWLALPLSFLWFLRLFRCTEPLTGLVSSGTNVVLCRSVSKVATGRTAEAPINSLNCKSIVSTEQIIANLHISLRRSIASTISPIGGINMRQWDMRNSIPVQRWKSFFRQIVLDGILQFTRAKYGGLRHSEVDWDTLPTQFISIALLTMVDQKNKEILWTIDRILTQRDAFIHSFSCIEIIVTFSRNYHRLIQKREQTMRN